jgi:hypothetical protein
MDRHWDNSLQISQIEQIISVCPEPRISRMIIAVLTTTDYTDYSDELAHEL